MISIKAWADIEVLGYMMELNISWMVGVAEIKKELIILFKG